MVSHLISSSGNCCNVMTKVTDMIRIPSEIKNNLEAKLTKQSTVGYISTKTHLIRGSCAPKLSWRKGHR